MILLLTNLRKELKLPANNERLSRIKYLDIAKAIGIILVVIGHIEKNHLAESVSKFIFSFHMPLFFILSGIVINMKREEKEDFKLLSRKKIKALMVPYLWFSLIFIVVDVVQLLLGYASWDEVTDVLVATITLYADSTLWFLPALLIAELLFIFIKKKLNKYTYPIIILLAAAAYGIEQLLPITEKSDGIVPSVLLLIICNLLRVILRGMISSLFVLAGFALWTILPKSEVKMINRCLLMIVGIVLLGLTYFISEMNTLVDLRRIEFGNVSLFLVTATAGSIGVILIAISIWALKPLEFIGRNTLIIMASHLNFYILFAGMQFGLWVNNYINHMKSYIFIVNVLIVVFAIECILIFIIRKFAPFIIGQKYEDKKV